MDVRHYQVKAGDTLWKIAQDHDVSVAAIEQANSWIANINQIQVGWVFHIPASAVVVPPVEPPPIIPPIVPPVIPPVVVPPVIPPVVPPVTDPVGSLANAKNNAGFYSGSEASGVNNFASYESQMGRKFKFVDLNVGHVASGDFSGSAWGNFVNTGGWQNRKDLTVCLTVPLRLDATGNRTKMSGGPALIKSELQATANGSNDARYRLLADRLIAAGHNDAILRLGHEGDITWYPWSWLNGNAAPYIAAFRHVVDVFRAKSSAFKFDYQGNGSPWNANYTVGGVTKPYGDHAYPGDAYCDIVGVDTYNRQSWSATTANLNYTLNMAKTHGKAMSVPEWGLWLSETGDSPTYIQNMFNWLSTVPPATGPGRLAYHVYFWNHPQANLNSAPNSKAKYKQLFA